jgi:hypothetical protein
MPLYYEEKNMRHIFIGDVHGCLAELEDLLAKVGPVKGDKLIFVGDLVDRGPNSLGVIRRVKGLLSAYPGSTCVAGNHEDKVIRQRIKWRKTDEKVDKAEPWVWDMTDADEAFLINMPLVASFPDADVVAVHGGFFPAWTRQYGMPGLDAAAKSDWRATGGKMLKRGRRLMFTRNVNSKGQMVSLYDIDPAIHPFWTDTYFGKFGFVVYGHSPTAAPFEPRLTELTAGIDTGAVFGGRLTAMIVDEWDDADPDKKTFVSVAARKRYAQPFAFKH